MSMMKYTYFRDMRFPYNVIQFFKDMRTLIKWAFQKLCRGYADYEVWSLNSVIADFVIPRLKKLKIIMSGYPVDIWNEKKSDEQAMKEWRRILDKMITAFELFSNDWECNEEKKQKVEEGLDLFRKYYINLWD